MANTSDMNTLEAKKRILIIGAGDCQLPLVESCADSCDISIAAPVVSDDFKRLISDYVLCDVRDFATIMKYLDECGKRPIEGVITDGTDIPVLTVARVADALGLPGIGEAAGRLFTDKALMRNKMDELGILTLPYYTVHSLDEAIDAFDAIPGDVIIKPVDSQGSRGVQVCRTKEELVAKYPEAARWSSAESKGSVLIEKYIGGGREFVVEGLAFDGDFWNLCIGDTFYFDIDDSLSAKERTFPTIANDELRDRVLDLNERIIRGFGLKQGITHSEFIMDGDDIYLLETAARGGGAFISSDLIPLSCGLDTAQYLIGIATGTVKSVDDIAEMMGLASAEELDTIALNPRQHCCYVAFYIPAGTVLSVEGAEEVRNLPYVHRTQIEHLESLVGKTLTSENNDKTSRYLVTISAPDRATLEQRMQFVRNTIKMDIKTPDGEVVGLIWE